MTKGKVKIVDVPEKKEFTGYMSFESVEVPFTPDKFFDMLCDFVGKRPVFRIRSRTYKEKNMIYAEQDRLKSLGLLWVKQNNIPIAELATSIEYTAALNSYLSSVADAEKINRNIFDCIVSVNDKILDYESFQRLPRQLISELDEKITEISELKQDDNLGL